MGSAVVRVTMSSQCVQPTTAYPQLDFKASLSLITWCTLDNRARKALPPQIQGNTLSRSSLNDQ